MDRIPCDNQIRAMLDPVEPTQFHPAFATILAEMEQSGVIDQLRVLNGHLLIALDGTKYSCSTELHCPNCSARKRSNGKVESHHALLAATLVCPGHNHAVPLEPEFQSAGWPREAVRRGSMRARISSSCVSPLRTRPSRNTAPASRLRN